MIAAGKLLSQAREQGVETIEQIKTAHLEGDGRISVIPREEKSSGGGGGQKKTHRMFQQAVISRSRVPRASFAPSSLGCFIIRSSSFELAKRVDLYAAQLVCGEETCGKKKDLSLEFYV